MRWMRLAGLTRQEGLNGITTAGCDTQRDKAAATMPAEVLQDAADHRCPVLCSSDILCTDVVRTLQGPEGLRIVRDRPSSMSLLSLRVLMMPSWRRMEVCSTAVAL